MAGVRHLLKDTERDEYFASDEQWTSDCAIAPTGALQQPGQLAVKVRPPRQRPRYWGKIPVANRWKAVEIQA